MARPSNHTYKSMPEGNPTASVIIVTRNRKADLRRALYSTLMQDIPCEVIVVDDASTDGTVEMVRQEFTSVRLVESEISVNCCVQRNRAASLAHGEYIISIDDDAEFSTASIVRQTLADFSHPRIAAVSIPHKDILVSPEIRTPIPAGPGTWVVGAFVGTAYAVRRDVFLQFGGYREALETGTEERDFCLRLLNFGYVTALGTADPILHYASPVRDGWRRRMLERRNDLCHAFWNVPLPDLICHFPGTIFNGLRYGLTHGCLYPTFVGYIHAIFFICQTLRLRNPVAGQTYRLGRKLSRIGILPLEEVAKILGPLGRGTLHESELQPGGLKVVSARDKPQAKRTTL
ncbi:glycosyltransferase family A protein [Prosthecobacter sp.]|uniref:glycosyltransferase family 2 protein n=1 Tax=Prosthecobacter sp. TaxID=1965333 RepID=UPI002ABAE024|nr:glycosyltransferase family A protein [Prosthecobacter sp.]MDZ4401088.1 glycosyltransferase family A protein [Prosthecobacter sp.]